MNSALAGGFGRAIVAGENVRVAGLSQAVAEKVRGDAASAGVVCTVDSPSSRIRTSLPSSRKRLACTT